MVLAVVTLHEKFTVLQTIGAVLMLGGSFITQSEAGKPRKSAAAAAGTPASDRVARPNFRPRVVSGYILALGAALCYGVSPLMAREAFLRSPGTGPTAAGCVAMQQRRCSLR